jgi:thioredoxin-dependent peroxiredoxin
MLAKGDPAPDFVGMTARGTPLRLSSLKGRRVVLYFYPKASSPGCTRESREFADRYARFQERGVEVVGVSVDDQSAQKRFAERCSLPFPLVADLDREISRQYGVLGAFGYARRITFLLDPVHRVEHVVESFLPGPHVAQAERLLLSKGAMPAAPSRTSPVHR